MLMQCLIFWHSSESLILEGLDGHRTFNLHLPTMGTGQDWEFLLVLSGHAWTQRSSERRRCSQYDVGSVRKKAANTVLPNIRSTESTCQQRPVSALHDATSDKSEKSDPSSFGRWWCFRSSQETPPPGFCNKSTRVSLRISFIQAKKKTMLNLPSFETGELYRYISNTSGV